MLAGLLLGLVFLMLALYSVDEHASEVLFWA